MKQKLVLILLLVAPILAIGQKAITTPTVVEASCGQCQFGKKGKGCDLAIRYHGKTYFVEGANIDAHGDAHAKDGFCNAVRKAQVTGKFKRKRFFADSFKLLN